MATYASHMLDGLDFLYKKTDDAIKTMVEVQSFFRKMAALEKKFGGEIQTIAKRYAFSKPFNEEIGTIRKGWDSMQQELENIGTKHGTLAESITKELVEALNAYIKKKETDRKKLVKDGGRITGEMKASLSDLATAKSKFVSACKSADSAAGAYSKAKADGTLKPKDVNKFSQKASKSADLANAAEKEYKKQLEKTNQKQNHFYDTDLPSLLTLFQEWEEERTGFLKSQFDRYSTFYCGFPPFMDMSCQAVKKVVDEIDIAADTQSFLEKHKTGINKPPDIGYEAYTPQNPDLVITNSSASFSSSSSSSSPSPSSGPSSPAPAPTPTPTPSSSSGPSSSPPVASRSAANRAAAPLPPGHSGSGSSIMSNPGGGGGGGNIVETNIPISKEIEVNENDYGLTAADQALPPEFKQEKLKKQLKQLKENIRSERKTAKGIEKLVKFYASDPAAQEKTNQELIERKNKIAKMKDIQTNLEAELAKIENELNPGGAAPAAPGPEPEEQEEEPYHQEEPQQPQQQQQQQQPPAAGWSTGEIVEEEVVVLAKARGLYEYVASNDTELSFKEGDIMQITDQDDSGWWFAEIDDRSGFVPKNYLEVVEQY
uniref:SH3 domain-containing protein n=1 Tax=Paramoeba aestuarina TaxID=180227 RepID=A0A7S4N735_9EUKA|mmetsp:Transcript_11860/g.17999  ORF Transcript_11860/g.17999 Transcript_11860/m.17999 type:complete len:600 (+) Transcript_11860:104-1903(+)